MKQFIESEYFRRFEKLTFLAFLYSLALYESPKNVLWGILLFCCLLRWVLSGKRFQWNLINLSIGAWIVAGGISSVFAIQPSESVKGLWDIIRAATTLGIASEHLRSDEDRNFFLRHLMLATALASIFGFYDYYWARQGHYRDSARVQLPSIGHFNQSGIYLAMVWITSITVVFEGGVFQKGWVGILCLLIISAAFLGTTARTAILTSLMVTGFIVILKRGTKRLVWIWIAALLVGSLIWFTTPSLASRVFFRGSFANRLQIWHSAWYEIKLRPFTGVGLNNFKNVYLVDTQEWSVFSIDHAHNVFINAWAQSGVLGLVAVLCLAFASIRMVWKSRNQRWLYVLPGLGACCIIFGVGMSHSTLHHEISMMFFLLLSLLPGSDFLHQEVSQVPVEINSTRQPS